MAYTIFISFSNADGHIVNEVINTISDKDVHFFVANYSISPGESISKKLKKGIEQCDLFVLIWSRNAKESNWVQQEIGYAIAKEKNILPLVLHKNIELPAFIRDIKYLEIHDDPYHSYWWLKEHVFQNVKKKNNKSLLGLGVAASLLYLLSKEDES